MKLPPFVILVMGRPKAGKSTASQIIAEQQRLNWADTSDTIYKVLAARRGVTVEYLKSLPKEQIRPDLIALGNSLCEQSALALAWPLIEEGNQIVCGIRRRSEELNPLLRHLALLGVHTFKIWIDNPNAPKVEDNTTVTADDCDTIIDNSGTIDDLRLKLETLLHNA